MTWGIVSRSLRGWWLDFKRRNLVADDPYDVKADEVVAQVPPRLRIMPCGFQRPNGDWVMGWRIYAQNDAARAELLYCVDCLPHAKAN